jgi:hypothetical protein
MSDAAYACEFCKRTFTTEKYLINHSCEKKRRWFQRDEPHARFGFLAWNRFYTISQKHSTAVKKHSQRHFIDSPFYTAFVKFGRHIVDLDAINPDRYIDYVIKANIPIDRWCNDFVYEQYVRDLTKKESAEDALERNILLMQQWSNETGEPWHDFFKKINTNQAIAWLRSGRISPWILYNAGSADSLFTRCTPEQLDMIKQYAPTATWKLKFSKNQNSVKFLQDMLQQAGL